MGSDHGVGSCFQVGRVFGGSRGIAQATKLSGGTGIIRWDALTGVDEFSRTPSWWISTSGMSRAPRHGLVCQGPLILQWSEVSFCAAGNSRKKRRDGAGSTMVQVLSISQTLALLACHSGWQDYSGLLPNASATSSCVGVVKLCSWIPMLRPPESLFRSLSTEERRMMRMRAQTRHSHDSLTQGCTKLEAVWVPRSHGAFQK